MFVPQSLEGTHAGSVFLGGCVASRESKVTAVWRRRRGITPAITWAARRHRVSKLLPDNEWDNDNGAERN